MVLGEFMQGAGQVTFAGARRAMQQQRHELAAASTQAAREPANRQPTGTIFRQRHEPRRRPGKARLPARFVRHYVHVAPMNFGVVSMWELYQFPGPRNRLFRQL
jgi:hypothetical protein